MGNFPSRRWIHLRSGYLGNIQPVQRSHTCIQVTDFIETYLVSYFYTVSFYNFVRKTRNIPHENLQISLDPATDDSTPPKTFCFVKYCVHFLFNILSRMKPILYSGLEFYYGVECSYAFFYNESITLFSDRESK